MGITEYVPTKHTFSVLICAFDEDCVHVARRIQRACPQVCGLYTYNSTSGSQFVDPLFDVVIRQYTAVVFVCRTLEMAEPAVSVVGRNPALVTHLRRRCGSSDAASGTCVSLPVAFEPSAKILLSARALNEPEMRNPIIDRIVAALLRV
jgi:hypothetical protein